MEIKTVSIIGLGALGVLYGHMLSKGLPKKSLRIVADDERINRYRRDGVFCNGERCRFHYIAPDEKCVPADLVLIAVKYNDLDGAIKAAVNQVGPNTIILSLLNGISSENLIGQSYGPENVLLCVAQGMDAVKTGNRLTYQNTGLLSFGDWDPGIISDKVKTVKRFFLAAGIPHEVIREMRKRQWSKFMFNVGINQTTAIFLCNYAGLHKDGPCRNMMVAAMEEVIALSEKENVRLSQVDIDYWLKILDGLNPNGKTSMQQDVEARRYSEVEMFGGTVLELGKKYGLNFPVNQMLYDQIKTIESAYQLGRS